MAKRRVTAEVLGRKQRTNLVVGRRCGGVGRPEWAFETEEERRAAWEAHKEELLAASRPGRRPAAYWEYFEGGDPRIPHETDLQALVRLELLSPDEERHCKERGLLPVKPATGADPRESLGSYG